MASTVLAENKAEINFMMVTGAIEKNQVGEGDRERMCVVGGGRKSCYLKQGSWGNVSMQGDIWQKF